MMKKVTLIMLCFVFSTVVFSACTPKQKAPAIKYQRKLEKYLPQENNAPKAKNTVDLSEGPKLKYDAKFGPKDLNFDIKVVNPY